MNKPENPYKNNIATPDQFYAWQEGFDAAVKYLFEPCNEHPTFVDDAPKTLNKTETGWNYLHRKDCGFCMSGLKSEVEK